MDKEIHGSPFRKRLGRVLRWGGRTVAVLLLAYIGLHAFPQVLFAHSVTAGGVTVYARKPLPPETQQRIAETVALVGRSELAVAGRREKIFVCNSPWVFRLFSPRSVGAFAASVSLTDNVFIADSDLARNVSRRAASSYNTRSFTSVAAHEITHGLIRRKLGLWRAYRLPDWIAEGYCEYVAGEGSFPEEEGNRLLAAGERDPSSAFRYFLYRKMVTHLIEKGLSFEDIVNGAYDAKLVEADVFRALAAKP